MNATAVLDLKDAAAKLKQAPAEMGWTERRKIATRVVAALHDGSARRADRALLEVLAADSKWEVRREIAEALVVMPDAVYPGLASKLTADANSFVRRAANRAVDRRKKTAKKADHAKKAADEISQLFELIEDKHGRRAVQRARRACERYNELVVGSMVHDLRSILTYLETHCGGLIDEGHKRRRLAIRVREDIEFLTRTLDDMDAFTRPAPTTRHRERLSDLVAAATELAQEYATKCGCDISAAQLVIDVPETITVEIVRHLIVMALANVLKNAIEACGSDSEEIAGLVKVQAVVFEERAVISISDNGIGMSDEEKQGCSLFVPGRRNKGKQFSTGYGLPIAARNVSAHGGSLTLESREDEGTTVTITLPLSEDD